MSAVTEIGSLVTAVAALIAAVGGVVKIVYDILKERHTDPYSATTSERRARFRFSSLLRRRRYVIAIVIIVAFMAVAVTTYLAGGSTAKAAPTGRASANATTAPASVVPLASASSSATRTFSPSPAVSPGPTASGIPSASAAGSGSPSPSVQPQPQPPAPPAALSVPNPYEATMQKLILDDPMTSNNGTWHNPAAATGSCTFAADGLHVAANSTNAYHECHDSTHLTDFTFEVSFTYSTATTAGLFFRDQGDGSSWYFAEVRKDTPNPFIGKSVSRQNSYIGSPDWNFQFSSVSGRHTLAVVAIGPKLTFFVDHQQVASGIDPSAPYTSGPIGVLTANTGNGGETVFRDARVWVAG